MSTIPLGGPGEIPLVDVKCPANEFDNAIRKFGVVAACEWFDHKPDSDFTRETVIVLCERSMDDGKAI